MGLIQYCLKASPESYFLVLSLMPDEAHVLAAKWLRPGCFLVIKVPYEEYVRTTGPGVIIDSVKEIPNTSSLPDLLNIDREDSSREGLKEYRDLELV